jgi:hypothetical protein
MADAQDHSRPPPTTPKRSPSTSAMMPADDASARASDEADSKDRTRFVQGIVLGFVIGVVMLVATPLICSAIDARMSPGELAGLGGLFLGAFLGAGLLVVATVITFALPARRRRPLLRGFARGMLLVVGLAALTAGVCAVA